MFNRLKAVVSVFAIAVTVAAFVIVISPSSAHAESFANRHSNAPMGPQCTSNVSLSTDATYFYTNGPNRSYSVTVYSGWTCGNWYYNKLYVSASALYGSYSSTQTDTCYFCADYNTRNSFSLPGPGGYGQCNEYYLQNYLYTNNYGNVGGTGYVYICYE